MASLLPLLAASALAAPVQAWVNLGPPESAEIVRELGLGYAEGHNGDWVRFDGEPAMFDGLDQAGVAWSPVAIPPPLPLEYHSPTEMVRALDALVAAAPELVARVDLGQSHQGQPIVGLRISATDAPALNWRILGAHHGDEPPSAELALATAQALVAGYPDDPDIQARLSQDAVWVVPHVNPDGVAAGSRYNDATVDLNRNYGYLWSVTEYRSGSGAFSEPETRAIQALGGWTPFAAGLSMHAGEANLGWVWNHSTDPTPDAAVLEALAQSYADHCSWSGFWLTNGAEWYQTKGDTNDWSYGRWGEAVCLETPPT